MNNNGLPVLHYFEYDSRFYDTSAPVGDHAWGEIKCKSSGDPLATIDFWKGCRNYWRPGRDSFGYTANKVY
jgi:hypothetical protein